MSRLRRLSLLQLLVAGLQFCATGASADFDQAKSVFDRLDADSRVTETLGLIATGDFDGLLDFGFTKRYYSAIIAFQRREGFSTDGVLDETQRLRLDARANEFYGPLGLRAFTHPVAGSKLLVPRRLFDHEIATEEGLAFERDDSNLSLSFVAYDERLKSFDQLFAKLSRPSHNRTIRYQKMREGYFVINGTYKQRNFYTWMSRLPSRSTGFTVSWSDEWADTGMKISILLANAFAPIPRSQEDSAADAGTDNTPPPKEEAPNPDEPHDGTGTGFKVSSEGHVLTNFHVAGNCKTLKLRRPGEIPIEATLVASDKTNDLALLKAQSFLAGRVAEFAGGPPPRAGTDIVVFGFPLSDILSDGGNIVTGNITALAGFGNDSRLYQISAPVQPGNSGGPVVDRQAHIIGVVVSKLDAVLASKTIGDIPQNVNFAIKASVAVSFLEGANIAFEQTYVGQALDTPAIADVAKDFTYLVECRN